MADTVKKISRPTGSRRDLWLDRRKISTNCSKKIFLTSNYIHLPNIRINNMRIRSKRSSERGARGRDGRMRTFVRPVPFWLRDRGRGFPSVIRGLEPRIHSAGCPGEARA